MDKGLVHLYWGNGKGKTTAAMGLAVRALGRGLKVSIVQFLKSGDSGELEPLRQLGADIWSGKACSRFFRDMTPEEREATRGLHNQHLRQALESGCDLLILDDFLLHTITDEREIKVLFEVMEKRSELSRCTIVCSQREPNSWASMILNDEVSANAILKRATKHYTVVIQPRS